MGIEVNKETNEVKGCESITEAYEAGKRAGMIEGYLRATENLQATIPRLQAIFIKKIRGANDQHENE
jgi:hypothetical protein